MAGSAWSAVSIAARVTLDALFDLCHAALHLGAREVLVTVVHRFELAAIDCRDRLREQIQLLAQHDELPAHLEDRWAVVLAEVSNGLEVRPQATGQPHHLDVALGLPLQASAGLNPIKIAVDVNLQQRRRMVGGPAGRFGLHPVEAKLVQIKPVDEHLNGSDGIIFCDVVVKAFGKQSALGSVCTFDVSLHRLLAS
jgi:hypothetical protein